MKQRQAGVRTALFGGTFDPVHNTHLAVARAAADAFGLERVLFIPAGNPPFKAGTQASWEDRLEMLRLAIAETRDERLAISDIERPSPGGEPSYSILTVEKLLSNGSGPLGFIVGADAFADLSKWYRWEDLARAVKFIVVPRPGATYTTPRGATVLELEAEISPDSSSHVRRMIQDRAPGLPVPGSVLRYINAHDLYRAQNRSQKS